YFEIGIAENSKTPQNCLNVKYPKLHLSTIHLERGTTLGNRPAIINISGFAGISGGSNTVKSQRLIPWSLGGGYTMGDSLLEGFTATWYYGFRSFLKEVWAEYCDFKIVFAGHSIGACVSQMLAYVTVRGEYWEKDLVSYYGYGAPRCGDQDYAAVFDQTVPNAYRINWNSDPVVNLAANSCPRTVDPVLGADPSCWFHCCTAIKYSSGGVPGTPCTIDDSATCTSGGNQLLNSGDHTAYYGVTSANSYNPNTLTC
ncbi:unnamed protein product, partial [Mesorhabditis belari]|uniref:Fungal lipase-type domain-containing protein n=1 Tax=Mesorhabditis belari TaxID=2138241 RepID=A0AAF3J852_9BILA